MLVAMTNQPIDAWDVATYPKNILELLANTKPALDAYYLRKTELDNADDPDSSPAIVRENELAVRFHSFIEDDLMRCLGSERIRGWHYCRLTDQETQAMENGALISASKASLKQRLENLPEEFRLSGQDIELICAQSLLNDEQQRKVRSHRFFMVSKPLALVDPGVRPLTTYWGGEIAYLWLQSESLKENLSTIGAPRIVECHVPVRGTHLAYCAAMSIVETYCKVSQAGSPFDFHASPKGKSLEIVRVHSEGDPVFDKLRGKEAE